MSTTSQSLHRELPHADDELMTLKEVAALVRVPEATLRYWRHLGTGPVSFKLGRHVLYRRADIDAWINAQHDSASADQSA